MSHRTRRGARKQPNSRNCFVCGRQNPVSLGMEWWSQPEERIIVGEVTVPERYNGYPGVVHGGIVAAILDETAGRAIILDGDDQLMVTLRLEVAYRRPTPTGTPLTAIGRIVRRSASRASVEAELRLPDGTVTATCTATVVKPPPEIQAGWEEERKHWRVYEEGGAPGCPET